MTSGPAAPRRPEPWRACCWTVEPGFRSTLEMKNNLMAESITAWVSLHPAGGERLDLPPIDMAPRQTVVVDLNRMVEVHGGAGRRSANWGSLQVRFDAETPARLMGAVSVINSDWGTGWNFFLYPGSYGLPNEPVRGLFWFQDQRTDGFVVVHNGSDEVMTVAPRFEIASQSYSLDWIQLDPGQGFKLPLRDSLRRLGLGEVEAGGLELAYEGAGGALSAQGVLFNRRGFSAEVEFLPALSYEEPQEIALRTPRFALGDADPVLGLPARTRFEPFLALHNFNPYVMEVELKVEYRDEGEPQELSVSLPLPSGQTELLSLYPYLEEAVPARESWASLEVSYTSRRRGLAAALVSVSEDGGHSIRSVMNWVQLNIREGWYWRADADANTLLGIFNADSEEAAVWVTLDYFAEGASGSYELPELVIPARSSHLVNLGEILASQIPDEGGNLIPPGVTFGGYRVERMGPLGPAGITTEALIFDRRRKSSLTLYNTGCCWFKDTVQSFPSWMQGYPGGGGQLEIWGENSCWGWTTLVGQYSSRNANVAQVGWLSGTVSFVDPGARLWTRKPPTMKRGRSGRTAGVIQRPSPALARFRSTRRK